MMQKEYIAKYGTDITGCLIQAGDVFDVGIAEVMRDKTILNLYWRSGKKSIEVPIELIPLLFEERDVK